MLDYTPHEIIDMILLGECRGNYRATPRLYCERYPDRRHSTHMVLRNCFQHARQKQLVRSRAQRGSSRVWLTVLVAIVVNPNISVQEISCIHGISRSIASWILRNSCFQPYRISLIHELTANDFALRVNFCRWTQQRI